MNPRPSDAVLKRIKLMVFDVDGVLTDGKLIYSDTGDTAHAFNVRDGYALVLAPKAGLTIGIISGRHSAQVARRLRELRVSHIHQAVEDKATVLRALCERVGIPPEATSFMGDDVNDLPAMRVAGLSAAPSDAAPEVHRYLAANGGWRLDLPGGHGAARQLVQAVMEAQGRWIGDSDG